MAQQGKKNGKKRAIFALLFYFAGYKCPGINSTEQNITGKRCLVLKIGF